MTIKYQLYKAFYLSLVILTVEGVRRVQYQRQSSLECFTPECLREGKWISEAIDLSKSPCADFYDYACGGWMKQAQGTYDSVSLRTERYSAAQMIRSLTEDKFSPVLAVNKAKAMYRLCLQSDDFSQNSKVFENIFASDFPGNVLQWNSNPYKFIDSMIRYQTLGLPGFLQFEVSRDNYMKSRNILKVKFLPLILMSANDYQRFPQKTENFLSSLLRLMKMSPGQAAVDAKTIIEFDRRALSIEKRTQTGEARWKLKDLIHSIADQKRARKPHLDIPYWIQGLANYIKGRYPHFDMSTISHVILVNPARMAQYAVLIADYYSNPRVIANKVAISAVLSLKKFLPRCYRNLVNGLYGVQHPKRSDECLSIMPFAESRLYLDSSGFQKSRVITDMVNGIHSQMVNKVRTASFMDPQTKSEGIRKIQSIQSVIGGENWLFNNRALDEYYHKVVAHDNQPLRSYLTVKANAFEREFLSLDRRYIQGRDINSVYEPKVDLSVALNKLYVNAGMIQPPNFYANTVSAVNFGALGTAVGHELSHSVDATGREYDSKGAQANWWTPRSIQTYQAQAQCVAQQYSKLITSTYNGAFYADGSKTLNENIADIIALNVSYYAYKEYISRHGHEPQQITGVRATPDQLFFLSFATQYCEKISESTIYYLLQTGGNIPKKFRVNGPLVGFKPFIEAFGCRHGSKYFVKGCDVFK